MSIALQSYRSIPATGPKQRFGGVRLNRRGRIVIGIGTAVILAIAVVVAGGALGILSGAVSESPAAASSTASSPQVDHVTVRAGQTLWQIASKAAPNADPRETILQIRKLNDLPTSAVRAGQTILVPRY